MPSIARQKDMIRKAFGDCLQLYQPHQRGFCNLLYQAYEAAQEAERKNRRSGGRKWRMSVNDTALWFAVRWFLDVKAYAAPRDWLEGSEIRDDARLAYAAMASVLRSAEGRATPEIDELRAKHFEVLALDYTSWVAR